MHCSAILLCGGRGRRAGGADKGRLPYGDRSLAEQVLTRLAPQVDDIIISANRNLEWYRTLGHRVVSDQRPDYQGPLAGLEAALPECGQQRVQVVCCDMPAIPLDLVDRLSAPFTVQTLDLCYASDGVREHYLAVLMERRLLTSLTQYLDSGGRSVRGWFQQLNTEVADFKDDPDAFLNMNSPGIKNPP